jgi:predicted small secreted protein
MSRISVVFVLAAAAALAGCSTTRLVDTDVQAFSTVAAIPAGASYRFERLPSQQLAGAAQQTPLEQIATGALERVGLKQDEANARYSVQVGLSARREISYDPWRSGPGWGPGWGYGGGFYGRRYGYGGFGGYGYGGGWGFPDRILYRQQINLLVRDLSSGTVVYETHADHDSLQPADAQVLAVMFDSALHGFPNAPLGVRRVNVEIPR